MDERLVGLMRLLAAEDVFPLVAGEFAAPGIRDDLLNDPECGPSLRVYVGLTDGRVGADLSAEDRWRNRYYWFLRFADVHHGKFGCDAGIEDQASIVREEVAQFDIDPQEVEQLETAARPAH